MMNAQRITMAMLATAALLMGAQLAADEKEQPKKALPKAEELISQYIEATGGTDAWKKIHNRIEEGTVEYPAAGIKGTLRIVQAVPDLLHQQVKINGGGTSEEGYDGKVYWVHSSTEGDRLVTGEELAVYVRASDFYSYMNWKKYFEKAETIDVSGIDGHPAYRVKMSPPKDMSPEYWYFDKDSKLLVRTELTVPSPAGRVLVTATFSDYREVDGVKVPYHLDSELSPPEQKATIVITKVEQNTKLPADEFTPPKTIQELIQKQKPSPEPPKKKD